ncbi:MAG TPA: acyl-CoA thioesterase domain-containing protein [Acidimicrobiales bacterium]
MGDQGVDLQAIVDETVDFVTVRRDEHGGLVGEAPSWFGERLFGGFVVAQAVHAATRVRPRGKRLNSLHGYFLRPALAGVPITYDAAMLKDGRTLAVCRLDATQQGSPVFSMTCSFAVDGEGYEYELPLDDDPPPPEQLELEHGPGPWSQSWLGPTPLRSDGTRRSTHRAWVKVATPLPDDDDLHEAFIGFFSDMTGVGGRPLDLEHDITGMISLDHSLWFHRPHRADEWLFYDVHSLVNTLGRGVLRGTLRDRNGRLVASVAQEMLLVPRAGQPVVG